jgi:uncharacterized protein (TIGR00661 family)
MAQFVDPQKFLLRWLDRRLNESTYGRAHLIGQHLREAGHEVLFLTSGKALTYLRRHFGADVREIFGLRLSFREGRLSPLRTVAQNLHRLAWRRGFKGQPSGNVLNSFGPNLVITDFEPFSAWWAWRNDVPVVSIDNQHALTLCELEHPPGQWFARLNAHVVTHCHGWSAAGYILLNFFSAPVKSDRAVLSPPVVRPIVHSYESTCGDHIVVYTSDTTAKDGLLTVLNAFPEQRFRIYGFDVHEQSGNCEFRKTATEGFLSDLASCRGVIATAGFSLLSECLYFRKKMLLLPIAGQYEQIANAYHAQRLGLALYRHRLDGAVLTEYLGSLGETVELRADVLWPDNEGFFRVLHRTLAGVCPAFGPASAGVPVNVRWRARQAETAYV